MFTVDIHSKSCIKAEHSAPLIFIAGIRGGISQDNPTHTTVELKRIFDSFGVPFIYKAAEDDKDTDFSHRLDLLHTVRKETSIPVMAQPANLKQLEMAALVADVFMLTSGSAELKDMLIEIGRMQKPLILCKDLYSFSRDLIEQATSFSKADLQNFAFCESGTSFGYDDLVVDMRSIGIMQETAPVFFDAAYAFSHPNTEKSFFDLSHKVSMASVAYGAAALGLAGIIMDILPDRIPDNPTAPGMLTLGALPSFLEHILKIDHCAKAITPNQQYRTEEFV